MKYSLYLLLIAVMFCRQAEAQGTTYHVGTPGSFLDLQNLKTGLGLVDGDIVIVNSGSYPGGIITNSRFTGGGITFKADAGGVTFTAGVELTNLCGFIIDHFSMRNLPFRGLSIKDVDTCTIQNFNIYNVPDYVFFLDGSGGSYDGTAATRFNNLRFLYDTVRAVGPSVNVLNTSSARSVTYNCCWRNCWFDSTYGATSTCLSFTSMMQNDTIDNCKFTNINLGGTSHNAVIYAAGHFIITNILSNNRQGNLIRARPYTVDSSASHPNRDTSLIANIGDCGARKYATVEWQQFVADTTTNTNLPNVRTGYIRGVNITALNQRTADYFPFSPSTGGGCGVLDVYDVFNGGQWYNCGGARFYIDSIPNPNSPPAYTFNYLFHDGGGTRPSGVGRFGDTGNNVYSQIAANLSPNWTGNDTLVMNIVSGAYLRGKGNPAFLRVNPLGHRGNSRNPIPDQGWDQFNVWTIAPVRWRAFKTVN